MSLKDTQTSAWEALPVTISNGAALTDTINLGGLRLFGITIPAEWTTANLTFQTSFDGGTTWANMQDKQGNALVVVATPNSYIALTPSNFSAVQYLRIRSGTELDPINQAEERTLKLILRTL